MSEISILLYISFYKFTVLISYKPNNLKVIYSCFLCTNNYYYVNLAEV